MEQQTNLEAFDESDDADGDFASEHDGTTVDEDIAAGRDAGEPESPRGWDGMDQEGAP
jgi:hypothetical protein